MAGFEWWRTLGKRANVEPAIESKLDFETFCEKHDLRPPVSEIGRHYTAEDYLFACWGPGLGMLCHPELDTLRTHNLLKQAKKRSEFAFVTCGRMLDGPLLVIAFPRQELLWEATEALVGESYGPSQGRFFPSSFPHLFAVMGVSRTERMLVHELTHAIFATCRFPRWIDEGLALLAEGKVFGAPEIARTAVETPTELIIPNELLDDFFTGALFDCEELNHRNAAYWYAFCATRMMYEANPKAFAVTLESSSQESFEHWLERSFALTTSQLRKTLSDPIADRVIPPPVS